MSSRYFSDWQQDWLFTSYSTCKVVTGPWPLSGLVSVSRLCPAWVKPLCVAAQAVLRQDSCHLQFHCTKPLLAELEKLRYGVGLDFLKSNEIHCCHPFSFLFLGLGLPPLLWLVCWCWCLAASVHLEMFVGLVFFLVCSLVTHMLDWVTWVLCCVCSLWLTLDFHSPTPPNFWKHLYFFPYAC